MLRQRPPARATGLGPNSAAGGVAPSTAVTRRRSSVARAAAEREVEHGLGLTDVAEVRQQRGPALVVLGLPRAVAEVGAAMAAACVAAPSA